MSRQVTTQRARIGLSTPCPVCADPERPTYCTECLRALSAILGETLTATRNKYGRKAKFRSL